MNRNGLKDMCKKSRRNILVLVVFIFTISIQAQNIKLFDFEVEKPSREIYEIALRLDLDHQVQFIQIELFDEENLIGSYEAILNLKADNYYLFFNDKEEVVYLDDLKIRFENTSARVNSYEQSIEIRLLDAKHELIDTYRKEIRY